MLSCASCSAKTYLPNINDNKIKTTCKINTITYYTGCPRMFYTQKCKIFRIFITIKTIEFGIFIYLSDWAVLLALWRILNQRN